MQDSKDNLLVQVFGSKYIRLYAPSETPSLYPHRTNMMHNTSQVDLEVVDVDRFPRFAHAPFYECILRPGEMLFIPVRTNQPVYTQ